jgi:hypothetical protein
MASSIDITVTAKGPLFEKKIDQVVKRAIIEEAFEKINVRAQRGGRGIGAKRNTVESRIRGLEMDVVSTLIWPRAIGSSWLRKNIGIIRATVPRYVRSIAKRIVGEMTR